MNKIKEIRKLEKFLLFFIILIEGFVSVAIEILVIRQLIPVAGTSVLVTSLIIGFYLLFLALGYYYGGCRLSNFATILQRNFLIAAIFIGIGLSFLFVQNFFIIFNELLASKVIFVLSCYLLLIIAPLAYFLGQTIPITMNLMQQEKLAGSVGGKVLFLSTVGSFFGAILTTLLMMEYLGVAWTVVINAVSLLFLSWLLFDGAKEKIFWFAIFTLVSFLIYRVNVVSEKQLFVQTTNYANYQVVKRVHFIDRKGDLLLINNSPSSFLDINKSGFAYIELIKKILFQDLKLHGKNILVIGAGGFTLSAATTNNNQFTYLDIDPKILKIVNKNYLSRINGKFIGGDARVFLPNAKNKYDVIVTDAYSNLFSIPPELLTAEYFNNIKQALTKEGIAVFNFIIDPFLQDAYSKRIDNTLRMVLQNCMSVPLDFSQKLTNVIYVCKPNVSSLDQHIYVDNKNPATINYFLK